MYPRSTRTPGWRLRSSALPGENLITPESHTAATPTPTRRRQRPEIPASSPRCATTPPIATKMVADVKATAAQQKATLELFHGQLHNPQEQVP